MSLRIGIPEDRSRKSPARSFVPSSPPSSGNFYIKSTGHVSRRNKSPFQKYEQCVKNSALSPRPPLPSLKKTLIDSSIVNKVPCKQVNKFEDLVIAAVNSAPLSQENNLICYKKRYLVNLSDSSWNLCNIVNESINSSSPIKHEEKENLLCSRCKSKVNEEENKKSVRFGDEVVITKQPPLGAPVDFEDKSWDDIKIDQETAEHFMDLLIAEDKLLRKK